LVRRGVKSSISSCLLLLPLHHRRKENVHLFKGQESAINNRYHNVATFAISERLANRVVAHVVILIFSNTHRSFYVAGFMGQSIGNPGLVATLPFFYLALLHRMMKNMNSSHLISWEKGPRVSGNDGLWSTSYNSKVRLT